MLISKIGEWFINSGANSPEARTYCDLDYTGAFIREEIAKYFDTKELETRYKTNYNEQDPGKKKGHSYILGEINLIYSLHKSFVTRYKSRLACYRDDASQKCVHTIRAMNAGYKELQTKQDKAEGL